MHSLALQLPGLSHMVRNNVTAVLLLLPVSAQCT
jgi:hypothetical protein